METMKVLYFHQHFSTQDGATGTRSYSMAQRLIERGHSVVMVCGSAKQGRTGVTGAFERGLRRGMVDGIDVVEFQLPYSNHDGFVKRTWLFIKFALRSVVVALQEPCDVVFATSTPLTAGIPGIVARWLGGRNFVFEVRDLWPELPRAMGVIRNPIILWSMSILEWMSYRSAHACIGLAPGIVKGILKRGVVSSRVHLIPNAADLDLFGRQNQRVYGKTIDPPFIAVFTGTHGQANGLVALLDVADELKRRGLNAIKLHFIGEGKFKAGLRADASARGLHNCVFLDSQPKKVLAKSLHEADVGLMILANVPAFYFGTSPNKFFDYLASGLPVICNYPGWVSELIAEHKCGIPVPPENVVAFANALEELYGDRETRLAMGKQARRLAEEQFDRKKLADQLVDVLEKVVELRTQQ